MTMIQHIILNIQQVPVPLRDLPQGEGFSYFPDIFVEDLHEEIDKYWSIGRFPNFWNLILFDNRQKQAY